MLSDKINQESLQKFFEAIENWRTTKKSWSTKGGLFKKGHDSYKGSASLFLTIRSSIPLEDSTVHDREEKKGTFYIWYTGEEFFEAEGLKRDEKKWGMCRGKAGRTALRSSGGRNLNTNFTRSSVRTNSPSRAAKVDSFPLAFLGPHYH